MPDDGCCSVPRRPDTELELLRQLEKAGGTEGWGQREER